MNKKSKLISLLIILIPFFHFYISYAQENVLAFDHYSVSNGLSNSVVNAICHDKYGFIWIGTDDGLNKFDGYNFKIYRSLTNDSASLSSSFILSLYNDSNGRLWAGTQKGLCLYNAFNDSFTRLIQETAVEIIKEDNNGNLICGTDGGIRVINLNNFEVKSITTTNGLRSNSIKNIEYVEGDKLLLNYLDRITLFSTENLEEIASISPVSKETFITITKPDVMGQRYLLSNERIIKLSAEMKELFSVSLTEALDKQIAPVALFLDSENKLWLSTDEGLYSYNREEKSLSPINIITDKSNVEKLKTEIFYEDRFGNLWLGVYGKGILLKPKQKNTFLHFKHNIYNENSLSHNMVSGFAEDSNGIIWIGTWGGGLNYYNPKEKIVKRYNFSDAALNIEIIRAICFDKDGDLWLATDEHGLVVLDIKSGQYKRYRNNPLIKGSLPDDKIYTVFSNNNGEIFIGHAGDVAGVSKYNKEKDEFEIFLKDTINGLNIDAGFVRTYLEDSDENIWFGTYGEGVHFIDFKNSNYNKYTSNLNPFLSSYLNNDVIYSLLEDTKGLIWIGTMGGGLNVLNRKSNKFWHITEKDGLANNVINGILQDDQKNLWISTNNGISRFRIPEIMYSDSLPDRFPEDYDLLPNFLNYNIKDGLQNNEFRYASCFKSSSGEMYFGGISGFNVFHPDNISINIQEPKIVMTGLSLLNQPETYNKLPVSKYIDEVDRIELKYKQNFITFDFIAINYNNSLKNRYMYMLEGQEDRWNSTIEKPSVSYMNLKPGEYKFRIRASNNDGIWTSESKDLEIYIKPPIWGRLWFQFMAVFIILGLLYSFYLYRLLLIKQRASRLEEKVKKRTNQLRMANAELTKSKNEIEIMANRVHETDQSKLKFFTNISHEFRTPLTLIVGPLERILLEVKLEKNVKNQISIVYRNAIRLLKLINELLDFRKLDTGGIKLQVAEYNIIKFVKGLSSLFNFHAENRNIKFSVLENSENLQIWFDLNLMEKVFYNLLSNAFKFTPDFGSIQINLSEVKFENKNYVKIEVQDNGKGISDKYRDVIFDRFYQIQGSGTQEPISSSGIGLALCKEYIELHHGKIMVVGNRDGGSTFTILLPKGKSHFLENEIKPEKEVNNEFIFAAPFENEYTGIETLFVDNQKNKDLPLVLIIDDNIDMIGYIKDILSNKYQVIFATDGKTGFDLANEKIPDLILSDIMMPGTDGLTLTKKLKEDEKSNHIPIIIVSARATEEDKITGLEHGADDYVSKPFSARVLLAKVNSVIENRKKIILRFKDKISLDFKTNITGSQDDVFLTKSIQILEKNLSNEEFNTEEFAALMELSRIQLYRKLLAVTDQTPSDFIRAYKMRKAIELLVKGENNISEVAYKVGFKSLSHFTRTFTKSFKKSPSQFLAKCK